MGPRLRELALGFAKRHEVPWEEMLNFHTYPVIPLLSIQTSRKVRGSCAILHE